MQLLVRLIFYLQKRKYGYVLASTKMWAHSPWLLLAVTLFYRAVDRQGSAIGQEHRRLVILYISLLQQCDFCIHLNTQLAKDRQIDDDKIDALLAWHDSEHFTVFERQMLAYCDAVFQRKPVDELLKTQLLKQLGKGGLVDLTSLVAFQLMSTHFNNALGISNKNH